MLKSFFAKLFASGVGKAAAAIVLSAAVVTSAVVGGVLVVQNINREEVEPTPSTGVFTPDIDPNAGTSPTFVQQEKPAESKEIRIPGYPSITLPKDRTDVEVYFPNPEENPCYFVFELVLSSTGETLYTSKMVPPGQAITSITLTRSLAEGEYEAVLNISTVSLEDGSPMNGANMKTTLIVK